MTRISGPVFIDKALQRSFDKNGFVKVQLLQEKQVDQLCAQYAQFEDRHRAIPIPFVSSSHSNDAELIHAVNQSILSVVEPEIGKHLRQYEVLFSNFLLKKSGNNSASDPHQDVTLVDEDRYQSYSIWIALTDIDEQNGCMRILQGSHRFPVHIRPNPSYLWRYRNVVSQIQQDMISCPVRKGEALIFSHSTIHGSFPNQSANDRLAAVIALYPEGAKTFHYHLSSVDERFVQKYAMTRDAFIAYIKGSPPSKGTLAATLPYDHTPVSAFRYWLEKQKQCLFR